MTEEELGLILSLRDSVCISGMLFITGTTRHLLPTEESRTKANALYVELAQDCTSDEYGLLRPTAEHPFICRQCGAYHRSSKVIFLPVDESGPFCLKCKKDLFGDPAKRASVSSQETWKRYVEFATMIGKEDEPYVATSSEGECEDMHRKQRLIFVYGIMYVL